jgi:CBS domain-containing protein
MRLNVPAVSPDLTVSGLVYDWILGNDERAFPVVANGHLAGLVCLEDVRKLPRDAWEKTRVREIMTPADYLAVVAPEDDANDALQKLSRRDVRQMPVVQNGHLVGLIRRRDFMKWLELHSEFATS